MPMKQKRRAIVPPETKDTPPSDPTKDKNGQPLPVIITEAQSPISVIQVAPDGVTPVPISGLGDAENTPSGSDKPVGGSTPKTEHYPTGAPTTMTVSAPRPPRPDVVKGEGATLAPTTTEQQDVTTAGQRYINRVWEFTQSAIALMTVISGVLINSIIIFFVILKDAEVSTSQLSLISISLQFINLTTGIIIGFYFSRTNHSAQGGVGPKVADAPYTGR